MSRIKEYNREKARAYAEKWAYARNPAYYNFDPVGGDCTSFVSQCILQGGAEMNYQSNGWYYRNGNDKSPSWSGVEFLYQFLLQNTSVGPFAREVEIQELEIGDIVQLSFDAEIFGHSILIVQKQANNWKEVLGATHTFDSYARGIDTYPYQKIRGLHIEGIRKW